MTSKAFHQLADEGKAITAIKKEYRKMGCNHTSRVCEAIVKLRILKKEFNAGLNPSGTTNQNTNNK